MVVFATDLTAWCGRAGNVAVKWASRAVSPYPEFDEGAATDTATSATTQPANSSIPATIGHRASLGRV